jgi:hypothetical protein
MLWDAATGAALQTLEVDAVVRALSFPADGSCIETGRRQPDTVPLCPSTVSSQWYICEGAVGG